MIAWIARWWNQLGVLGVFALKKDDRIKSPASAPFPEEKTVKRRVSRFYVELVDTGHDRDQGDKREDETVFVLTLVRWRLVR